MEAGGGRHTGTWGFLRLSTAGSQVYELSRQSHGECLPSWQTFLASTRSAEFSFAQLYGDIYVLIQRWEGAAPLRL